MMIRVSLLRPLRAIKVKPTSSLSMVKLSSGIIQSPQVRYNSTGNSISEKATEIKNTLTSFESIPDEPITTLSSDQIGYLDSIGMAQGFGPTALLERLLEISHVYTGLPWWGTIVFTTVAVRLVMFPLYVKSSINAAKMTEIKPQLDQVMKDLKGAESPQDQVRAAHKRKALMKEHDIHMSHQLLPMVQLPIAYGFFQATRKMANFPVDGFQTQGYAWFQDLSQVDPYCGLQVIAAALVVYMVRLGGETGAATMNPMMKKVMTYVPILSIFVTKELSAAVVLYFAANGLFSFIQAMVLRNKYFRKLANMPPIVKPQAVPGSSEPTTVTEWWKDFNQNMNKNVENKMKTTNTKLGAIEKRKSGANGGFIKRH
ncbi:uncharacterized protein PRCAT00003349001 [Priceomyces carsonii]|uniref:uncharacterized protein n=1 Tax=Priceomyces carsonii TaxID=28549 RepID=UPI002EDA33BA|nr:unnamed protein product [Priceomyces carsonii]